PGAIDYFRQQFRRHFSGDPTKISLYQNVTDGLAPNGIEQYLPLFFEELSSLFDFLPAIEPGHPPIHFMIPEDLNTRLDQIWQELNQRYQDRCHDVSQPILEPPALYMPPPMLLEKLADYPTTALQPFEYVGTNAHVNFGTQTLPDLKSRDQHNAVLADTWLADQNHHVLFCAPNKGSAERIRDWTKSRNTELVKIDDWRQFSNAKLNQTPTAAISITDVEIGFIAPADNFALVTATDLFDRIAIHGHSDAQRKRRYGQRRRDPDAIFQDLSELAIGAPIVHENYGVGRYRGLSTLEIGGVDSEFLTLEYAGGDKIYVPVHALHLVSRYIGADADHAPLHQLGTPQWEKAKKKAAREIRDLAADLLELYAQRAARSGHAQPLDRESYQRFCLGFPFDETPDQLNAINAVVEDLTAEKSMDRIVCGDVGFGKTEVALRAAFVTALAGQQVAILVPTTLLAQQHYRTFIDRFADTPVTVAELSRFRTAKENKQTLAALNDGKVDIVIGTHKLLQRSVKFHDLGLVIVDEEHRFGVRHKESLKSLRAEVDVLTLTATPIPRTLNLALGGLRDISIISTPPPLRHAVKTFVCEWNNALIRDACSRELKRGGQIFFVHNKVQSIYRRLEELQALLPEIDIRVAHGQMPERELEEVMLAFRQGQFDILLCTTIVESGLDIATANTILIDHADKLGLAQLHQLRGRVGRAHHRAYAYLLIPPRNQLTGDAQKRLQAIEATEELGIGFMLATHDLEIRGAGELLGDKQSGQIQEIGMQLYLQMLERTVKNIKTSQGAGKDTADLSAPVEIGLGLPAFLPASYLPDVELRLRLYKRLAACADAEEITDMHRELIDRFGPLPDSGEHLVALTHLKQSARALGIRKLNVHKSGARIVFSEQTQVSPQRIIDLIQSEPNVYKMDGSSTLRVQQTILSDPQRLVVAKHLLKELSDDKTLQVLPAQSTG
ncbi:MAG: transcription-repair coupling factor, partial [Gammaproteobacteria bacterium]|nr:transcription-repair coupling factor [Gammaproteobacteria bacterium]